ncbi:MAG TPA: FtsX-like permease family protein, partial [Chitinophagaceae bacterium]|nr:FtsX-like permease family protein [Chitinophagaceae bacterium]
AGFIANRIAFNQPSGSGGQKSFSRFIIRLSIVATIISVMVMIIALSLANGFKETVSQKVFSFIGHIRVLEKEPDKAIISEETPIIKNDTVVAAIRRHPEVKSIHPYATRYAILKTKEEIEGVLIKGFDSSFDFSNFKSFMLEGRPMQFNDSSYSREIMLSAGTASRLKLKLNERVLIYFIRPDGSLRPDKLTVTGIFKTGIEEYDKTFAIGDMKLIQRLNEWDPDEVAGYEIFLKDYKQIKKVSDEIYEEDGFPATWNTVTAQSLSYNIFDWLKLQDKNIIVLIIIVAAVAFINLITCFLILVLERVRMIGILKSLGATDWTVQKIFLRHAAIIAVTGIIIGAALALGLLWLQESTGFIRLKEEAYYVNTAAVKIIWWQVAAVCFGTLGICFLVLMIPSLLVKKIQPVRAVQFR